MFRNSRNSKHLGRWMAIAVATGLVCSWQALAKKPPEPPRGGPAYTIVPFLPPGFESVGSLVTGLNETGQAVGFAEVDNSPAGYRAVHYDIATEVYTTLQDGGYAGGVNNQNQIAGFMYLEDFTRLPAFWNGPAAAPVDLPLLPGHTHGWADRINDAGIITGISKDNDSNSEAVIWRVFVDATGEVLVDGPVTLPPLPGDPEAWTVDLNELSDGSCQVAGTSNPGDGVHKAVIWTVAVDTEGLLTQPGLPASVGTLGQLDPSYSQASSINDLGDLCGSSDRMPFVAPAGQGAQSLPVPRNTQWGWANDINNLGEIVGQLDIYKTKGWVSGPGIFHPYLWKNGDMIDLETQIDSNSGWDRLWGAYVINDAGIIAGRGVFDVDSRGFLLIPIEP